MGDFLTQFYLEHIRKHQQAHSKNSSLAATVLQTLAIDLSCIQCYPPTPIHLNPRGRFADFWAWYSETYQATSYNKLTQANFLKLPTIGRSAARVAARNIIFSCRYQGEIENPRDIVTTLFRRFTSHHSVPKVTAEQRILFDIFIDDPVKAQQHIEALQAAALESAQASEEETSASATRQISQETVITVEEPIITSTSTTTAVVTPTRTPIPIVDPNSLAPYSRDQTSEHYTYF